MKVAAINRAGRSSLESSRSSLGGRQTRRTPEMRVSQPPPSATATRFIWEVRPRNCVPFTSQRLLSCKHTHTHTTPTHQVAHTQKTHTLARADGAAVIPQSSADLAAPASRASPTRLQSAAVLGALSRDSLPEPLQGLQGSRGSRGLKLIFFLFGPAQPSLASCHQARCST